MFKRFEPSTQLKNYVLFYFELNWKKQHPNDTIRYLSLPTGCSFIGFQKKGRMKVDIDGQVYPTEKYYVNSQTTVPYFMCVDDEHLDVVVACLRPTALYHLFKINVCNLVDTGTNPKVLFPKTFDNKREALLMNSNTEDSLKILNSIFIDQVNISKPQPNFIDCAIDLIIKEKGQIKINDIVAKLNVSKRYFQKRFKTIVGISPFLYIKIIRYNFLFSSFKENDTHYHNSSAILYFYDSAHYSKSFKEYLGMSPSEFEMAQYPFIQLTTIEQAVWINTIRALSE